ncbi:MAG: CvpA family protein [Euryhalocaulis sp.]|uniref:CvpA family protein n=1 Tax=Euryhalocaulis sp. TaxID=2744307 RepID=UPI0017E2B8CC|nr:CvpA family protein [Euryhalocaulis sp.]MBA4800268.1 CvpA family protein [Euryhalocaulis sp.]
MEQPITAFDWAILAVLMASGLLALTRGFIRELLSVSAFVAAAFVSLFMFPVLREPARAMIPAGWAADLAAIGVVFLLVYLAVTLVTSSLSKRMRGEEEPGLIDRLAGFAFGLVRGVVVLALFVIVVLAISPPDRPPGWMVEARLYPMLNSTAVALQDLAPEGSKVAEGRLSNPSQKLNEPQPEAAQTTAETEDSDGGPGYEQRQRQSLDQLITTKSDGDKEDER